jgi:hypothetical protein
LLDLVKSQDNGLCLDEVSQVTLFNTDYQVDKRFITEGKEVLHKICNTYYKKQPTDKLSKRNKNLNYIKSMEREEMLSSVKEIVDPALEESPKKLIR